MSPIPILGGIQAAAGLAQTIGGLIGGSRARRQLDNLRDPTTTASSSIADYYNRASASPYSSPQYRQQQQNIQRATNTGINALQDRRSALGGLSGIIRSQDDSLLKAGANAEQQQWSRLGDATRLKAADDQRVYNQNVLQPFQRKYSMLASKAAGGNQIMNAGLQNVFGGVGTAMLGFGGNQGQTGGLGGNSQKMMQYSYPNAQTASTGLGYNSPANTFGVYGQNFNY